jgi:GrpB-like predicted nucleotidyltransferase (UPF0157 family)
MNPILVIDYDPGWVETFERLRSQIWPAVADIATAVEHVGSTSVPGLAAKPMHRRQDGCDSSDSPDGRVSVG